MDDNLLKYAQGLIKNLSDAAPNLQGFAKAIDVYAKQSIEDIRKTDPAKAEKMATEYSKAMNEAKLDEKILDMSKAFEAFKK